MTQRYFTVYMRDSLRTRLRERAASLGVTDGRLAVALVEAALDADLPARFKVSVAGTAGPIELEARPQAQPAATGPQKLGRPAKDPFHASNLRLLFPSGPRPSDEVAKDLKLGTFYTYCRLGLLADAGMLLPLPGKVFSLPPVPAPPAP